MQPLRRKAQFEAVLATPPMVQSGHFAVHGLLGSVGQAPSALFGSPGPWLGLVVPRRWARRAVTRNLIKRQARAVAAELGLPPGAWVLRLKRGWPTSEFPSAASAALRRAVRAELLQLLGQRLPQRLATGGRP
ncbi:MAG: ribonuclease P protein component [Tepidimonas sp.]|uniref:ribonuclease P protein component n=1 Tax=Tepidimonas sp. TaxID=2002775 RepID=UPI00298F1B87|nr:ribonuclease P protein component [Tepidimonas sp.]MDW8336012.1 ribonuclease P protein component [Tepidimonas sp.]